MNGSIALAFVLVAAGCASHPSTPKPPPHVPAALQPPPGQALFLEAYAVGVQIYQCKTKADAPGTFEWGFVAPEAELADRKGHPLGSHFAGPTWQSTDGSQVVGEVKARDPGPDPSAVPWLLLTAKSTTGTGVFARTKSLQRLRTEGGLAPPAAQCTADRLDRTERIAYKAVYYFYR